MTGVTHAIATALVSRQIIQTAEELIQLIEGWFRQRRFDNRRDVLLQMRGIARAGEDNVDALFVPAKAIGRFGQRRRVGFFRREIPADRSNRWRPL